MIKLQRILLATSNIGKINELKQILSPIECIPQKDLGIKSVVETGESFIENAILKARHASACSNLPALADDSGLVIPELKGEPGIFSARYAGEDASDADNIKLVLKKLNDIGLKKTTAYFYCAVALIQHPKDPTPMIVTGKLVGQISTEIQGTNGFGYDPIFYLQEYQKTMAELDINIKNKISHRALALQKLFLALEM